MIVAGQDQDDTGVSQTSASTRTSVLSPTQSLTSDVQYSQEFRLTSPTGAVRSSKIVAIPTRWDAKAGHYIVLWMDIQLIFKDVQRIAYNGSVIPPLTDDNSEE